MDYNHLKNRTDEILRERIRLGMTGGEMDHVGMGYRAHATRRPRRNTMTASGRTRKITRKVTTVTASGRKRLVAHRGRGVMAGTRVGRPCASRGQGEGEGVLVGGRRRVIRKSRGGSKTKRVFKEKAVKRPRLSCAEQRNPWLAFLCEFRERNHGNAMFAGPGGNKLLVSYAAAEYRGEAPEQGAGYGRRHHLRY